MYFDGSDEPPLCVCHIIEFLLSLLYPHDFLFFKTLPQFAFLIKIAINKLVQLIVLDNSF